MMMEDGRNLTYPIDLSYDDNMQDDQVSLTLDQSNLASFRQERQVMVQDPSLDQPVPARDQMMIEDADSTISTIQAIITSPNDILPSSEFDWLFATNSPTSQVDPPADAWAWSFFIDSTLSTQPQSLISTTMTTRSPSVMPNGQTGEDVLAPLELLSYTALNRAQDEQEESVISSYNQRSGRVIIPMEPRDLRAPSRRNSQPGTVKEWSNSWNPNAEDTQIKAVFFEDASEDILLLENTAQVEEFDERAKTRLIGIVHLAELPDYDSDQVSQMLSAISAATYNIMIQCFFERFQPNNPIIHRSTFHPAKCNALLLGAICATGTFFSQTPKAGNLGNVLIDLVHRAIFMTTTRNNLHARSLSNIQALVLICIYLGNAGNRRFLEHAEACRGAVITMVRRCRLLDNVPVPSIVTNLEAEKETRWKAWLHWETGRRTGWAAFLFDMELSSTWTLSPSFLLDELQTTLPCKEDLWEAPNADVWATLYTQGLNSATNISKIHEAFVSSRLSLEIDCLDTFQTIIVTQSLSLLGQSIINLLQSKLNKHARPLQQQFLLQIKNCISSSIILLQDGNHRIKWATAEIILNFDILRLFVDLHDLQALGGRKGAEETTSASKRLSALFAHDFSTAHLVAQHCAKTVQIAINHHIEIASLSTTLYYSIVYLYVFSKVWSNEQNNPNMKGSKIIIERVGDLASPRAPQKILSTMSNYFLYQLISRTWPTCKNLGIILSDMANRAL